MWYPCFHKWKTIKVREGRREISYANSEGYRKYSFMVWFLQCTKCGRIKKKEC